MKENIHPKYEKTTITCACGNVIETGSTKKDIRVEICSKCHPFFTGEMKFVDTLGRVERFQQKQKDAQAKVSMLLEKKKKKLQREEQLRNPKSLREMLMGVK